MRSNPVSINTVAYPTDYNTLVQDASGSGRLLAHQMLGYFTLSTNPTNGKTLTLDINGTNVVITFVSSIGSTAGNVLIGASAAATCANLLSLLLNPTITSSTQIAIGVNTAANTTLINYLGYGLTGTMLVISSMNNLVNAPLTSFSGSTNATSDSYTASTMTLYVEPGIVYVNGTEIYFTGGITSAVTAPSSHPRIDVLSMDNTGTLNWTTGTEASSPSTPTYPSNQIPICELYHVTGETALYDNANQQTGQGYIYNDVRPFLAYPIPLGAVPDSIVPAADGTYNLGSPTFEWNNVYAKTSIQVNGVGVAIAKFGGTGTDGALTVSSGTTTISAGSAANLQKNYTSISITSAGTVQCTTPNTHGTIVVLKSQGNVTLTSSSTPMLDASGMGAAGGTAGGNGNSSGSNGSSGSAFYNFATNGGQGGQNTPAGGTGAALPTVIAPASFFGSSLSQTLLKYGAQFWIGAGGGGGGSGNASNNATQGAGGNGGGGLIIECGGSLNFTTASGISVAGKNGANPTNTTYGGAGGGGAAGFCLLLYAALTASSGTITVAGGTGGNNGSNTTAGAGGGGGANAYNTGTNGGNGNGTTGGTGGNGVSLVCAVTDFT